MRAQAKWLRMSPQKARVVLAHIRGRSVPEARTVLAFSDRAVAKDIELVLRSAVANAEANHGLIGDELVVAEAYADDGPTIKRWRPRARGRASAILKRTCHITIRLVEVEASPSRRRRRRAGGGAAEQTAPAEKPKRATRAKKTEEVEA